MVNFTQQANTAIFWVIKMICIKILAIKNLLLRFDQLLIITFHSSFVTELQLFKRIYSIFSSVVFEEQLTHCKF